MLLALIEVFTGEDRQLDTAIDFSEFSYSWTCVLVFVIIFVLTMKRDLSIFIRINTYGVVFTVIIILFIIAIGVKGLLAGGYSYVGFLDNNSLSDEEQA